MGGKLLALRRVVNIIALWKDKALPIFSKTSYLSLSDILNGESGELLLEEAIEAHKTPKWLQSELEMFLLWLVLMLCWLVFLAMRQASSGVSMLLSTYGGIPMSMDTIYRARSAATATRAKSGVGRTVWVIGQGTGARRLSPREDR